MDLGNVSAEQRRLAAILVADVVGYSKSVAAAETATLARLEALQRELIEPVIARHAGRLFKAVGDGFLVEFASAVQAVTAAREIQDLNASGALPLRIGIHVGDVVVRGDDLLGDGVNIAARIEGIAEPGGIAISRAVHEQVRDRLDFDFADRGEVDLKNIARPVHVFALGGRTASPAPQAPSPPLALPDRPSIAVLPFQNMSGDPEQEYFVDGMAEDIITELSRFRQLFVISRSSSFTYKGRSADVRVVARELGVRHVLQGSSRKAGNRVRITAQLIDCESGEPLWAERYDRELADIFAIQEEITRAIVTNIAPAIVEATIARIRRQAPSSLTVHELVTCAWAEGQAAYLSGTSAIRDRALAMARRALELDADCARAWIVVAAICWQAEFYARRESTPETCREGLEAARRAVMLDRLDHHGYIYKGLLHLRLLQYDEALADLRQACDLNPNDATALQALAYAELMDGQAAAAKSHCLEALRLNPRDPSRYNSYSLLANICFVSGEYAEGLKWVAESKREHPDFPPTIMTAIKLHVGLGQWDRARMEADLVRSSALEAGVREGLSVLRRAEHRERENQFYRIGFGFEAAGSSGLRSR